MRDAGCGMREFFQPLEPCQDIFPKGWKITISYYLTFQKIDSIDTALYSSQRQAGRLRYVPQASRLQIPKAISSLVFIPPHKKTAPNGAVFL